jgi:hypothetical protein
MEIRLLFIFSSSKPTPLGLAQMYVVKMMSRVSKEHQAQQILSMPK